MFVRKVVGRRQAQLEEREGWWGYLE
jgi:hypothetical protein